MSNATRERIIDEAMRLFSEQGYAATSIAKIEAGAGLSAGAGGLYHHFKSKEAVLAAGIERQLSRLDALREIRHVLGPLGDLKSELTLIARYVLAELDSESELLRILAIEARNRPQLLTAAVDQLSFDVRPGVVTGFLGLNGSGKSTTMRLILGLDSADAGQARIGGRPYRDLRWPLREVGALLEARAFHPGRGLLAADRRPLRSARDART